MKGKILYMDDDAFFSDLLSKKIRNAGYEVDVVPNGEAGIKLIHAGYDLILLDIVMPRMDGFQVLKYIRDDATVRDIPVIVLSNLGSEEDINRARELGASVCLVKAAMIPSHILASIEQVLEQR
ncbi:MAG: response regulator [Patescibacteria group bacterium]|nr:response regulator [Patescibacteria group bacterium]